MYSVVVATGRTALQDFTLGGRFSIPKVRPPLFFPFAVPGLKLGLSNLLCVPLHSEHFPNGLNAFFPRRRSCVCVLMYKSIQIVENVVPERYLNTKDQRDAVPSWYDISSF